MKAKNKIKGKNTTLKESNMFFKRILILLIFCYLPSTQTFASEIEIEKSPNDVRNYRLITLDNQLEVLLISDPETQVAAAAIDVNTGYFDDPDSVPGLAHFLEHMLFLGTKKHPKADAYGSYLSKHGGGSNAYTSSEHTNYHFFVSKKKFRGALDRFSQFFIAPKFSPEYVERELNAIHAEHEKNLQSDSRRVNQILKSKANPQHPYSKFATGNRTTLDKPNIRNLLNSFYLQHYSANLMKLVLLGEESLDELEAIARKLFTAIPNRNIEIKPIQHPLFTARELKQFVNIKPKRKVRTLDLIFPLPNLNQYFESKPVSYISYMLGDEGPGSILAYLKKKSWANSLSSGSGGRGKNFSLFNMSIGLTEEGLKNIEPIVEAVFQYIRLLNQNGIQKFRFDEMMLLQQIDFQFQEKQRASSYVQSLASQMHRVPQEKLLTGAWLLEKYDPQIYREVLNLLNPENLIISILAQEVNTNQVEPSYGAEYMQVAFSEKQSDMWIAAISAPFENKDLFLPPPNIFVPQDLDLKEPGEITKTPQLISKSKFMNLWYLQDIEFKVPKVNWRIKINAPLVYRSPKTSTMSRLLTMLWQDKLNEFVYPAGLAGLTFGIDSGVNNLSLSFNGYHDKLSRLIEKVTHELGNLKIDPERLNIFKKQLYRNCLNQKQNQANYTARYEFDHLMESLLWHRDEYLEVIPSINANDLEVFLPKLFESIFLEVFVHGNISASEAEKISENFANLPRGNPLFKSQIKQPRTVGLPENQTWIRKLKVEDKNSAVQVYFQSNRQNLKEIVQIDLLVNILEKSFYHQLRTVEQLGYLVWSYPSTLNQVNGVNFVIQSPDYDPIYLRKRIEAFLRTYESQLEEISEQDFNSYKRSLLNAYREPFKTLNESTDYFWSQILSPEQNMAKKEDRIRMLESIYKKDVLELYKRIFGKNTKRLVIMEAFGKEVPDKTDQGIKINDRIKFKELLPFYSNAIQNYSTTD